MKNIYTSALACAAMLLAGASMAQSSSKETHTQTSGFQTLRPLSGVISQRGGGAPANDDCSGATVHNLNIGGNVVINGDNTGATDGEGFGFATTWEGFTITSCANITVSYCGTNPAFGNFALGIGDCPVTTVITPLAPTTDCDDGNLILFYEGIPAGTWYVPVLTEDGSMGPYVLTISAEGCTAPPANDDCAGATSLTSSPNCQLTYFNTTGATESIPAINCGGYTSPNAIDAWFSFVCTNAEQSIGVEGFNATDPVIELLSGTCDNLTSLDCSDASTAGGIETVDETGLTVGSTYYVRVYDYANAAMGHNFAICITEGSGNNVGINEQQKATALSVYPNPSNGDFNLQYTGVDGLGTIEVFDLTGRAVYSEQTQLVSGSTHSLDLSKLAQGQYSLRLTVNGTRSQQNLMVR
jgi:hypothetical protein